MITGLIVTGEPGTSQPVLLRGTGPLLGDLGVENVLADPRITLLQGGNVLASNDNWAGGDQLNAINASGSAPTNAEESVLMVNLEPGVYTVK
jgi:hypothetical protein